MLNVDSESSGASELRLDAYYYGFAPTGVRVVDELLAAVARAGKAYHLTENWNSADFDGKTPVEKIQAAAQVAADEIRRLSRGQP